MAFLNGGVFEQPALRPRRFFGPGAFMFQRTDHLPVATGSTRAMNFFRGIVRAYDHNIALGNSDMLPVAKVFAPTGGHWRANGLRYPTNGGSSAPVNSGYMINYDEEEVTPYPIAGVNGETGAVSNARQILFASVFVYMPSQATYDITWQDWGRSPIVDANDDHTSFMSTRRNRLVNIIDYQPGQSFRINGSVNIWRQKWNNNVDFDYRMALSKNDVLNSFDPDGTRLSGWSGAVGGFNRFNPQDNTYDSSYALSVGKMEENPYGWPVSAEAGSLGKPTSYQIDTTWPSTVRFSQGVAFFNPTNGAGVPYADLTAQYDEFAAGHIKHMLGCVVWEGGSQGHQGGVQSPHDVWNNEERGFDWPANRSDGSFNKSFGAQVFWDPEEGVASETDDGPDYIPVDVPKWGWVARLKKAAYETALSNLASSTHVGAPFARVLIRCLREYGMVIFDKNTFKFVTTEGGSGHPADLNVVTGGASVSDIPREYDPTNDAQWESSNRANMRRYPCFHLVLGYDSRFPAINMTSYDETTEMDPDNPTHVTACQTDGAPSRVSTEVIDGDPTTGCWDATTHCFVTEAGIQYDDFEFVSLEENALMTEFWSYKIFGSSR